MPPLAVHRSGDVQVSRDTPPVSRATGAKTPGVVPAYTCAGSLLSARHSCALGQARSAIVCSGRELSIATGSDHAASPGRGPVAKIARLVVATQRSTA